MAAWHLDELRTALEKRGWRITAELPGDDYKISGTWELRRGGDTRTLLLDFEGLDDIRTLPLAESYACQLRGTSQSIYFSRRGEGGSSARERWQSELASFVKGVDQHAV
jgi:hypothetical protein